MNEIRDNIRAYRVSSPMATFPATQPLTPAPSRTVRLFRNGSNQAVRIPKEFELPGKEAVMRRVGNTLVIEAVSTRPPKGTLADLAFTLREMAARGLEPIDEEFPDVDEGMPPLDDIDFGAD